MNSVNCHICGSKRNSGTSTYCSCPAGVFYSLNDEQFQLKLDDAYINIYNKISTINSTVPEYRLGDCSSFLSERGNLYLLTMLPFFDEADNK